MLSKSYYKTEKCQGTDVLFAKFGRRRWNICLIFCSMIRNKVNVKRLEGEDFKDFWDDIDID